MKLLLGNLVSPWPSRVLHGFRVAEAALFTGVGSRMLAARVGMGGLAGFSLPAGGVGFYEWFSEKDGARHSERGL